MQAGESTEEEDEAAKNGDFERSDQENKIKKEKWTLRTDGWVSELLAADCEKVWIHTGWEDTMQKWSYWLEDMKKKDEKEKMEEMHQKRVAQTTKSAEGSAGLLHKIMKPAAWRGETQIRKTEAEDARLLDRCAAKRKELAKHWQCDESVHKVEDKPWSNEELRRLEEALPRLKESHLEDVSRLHKAKTGLGCDGFHPKVPLDLTKERRGEIVEFPEKVEQVHNDVLFDPEEVHERASHCACANSSATTGCQIQWDATDGRRGGAERAVWETLNKAFQKNYTKVGVKKLPRAMPARTWRAHAVVMSPTERLKLRRQMAAAARKKSTTSFSLFMEAYGLEVEEELFHHGHSALGRKMDWKMAARTQRIVDEANSRSLDVEASERTCKEL